MVKVSIIMNCYNGEHYLKEAIDSVIAQTYENWELIFWDNQSTDASAQIAKSYDDSRIKYFYATKHTQLGEARNFAFKECGAEYLAFLDTDDIWLPNKLEQQMSLIESNSSFAMCYGDFDKISDNGQYISSFKTRHQNGYIFDKLLSWYEIGMPTVLIRAKTLQDINIPYFDQSLSFCPDYDLFMRIAAISEVCSIKEPIAKYRVTQNSLTSKTASRHSKELIYSLIKLEGLYLDLYTKYQNDFNNAYRWADIMQANYLLSIGKVSHAREYLYRAKYAGKKHFLKYIVSFFPKFISLPIYTKYFQIG